MTTSLPFLKELATTGGSSYVNAMMITKFEREATVVRLDELELRKKAQEIRSRVAERDFVIAELVQLFPFDSAVMSIAELRNMQADDATEISAIMAAAARKQTRLAEIRVFIRWLKGLPY